MNPTYSTVECATEGQLACLFTNYDSGFVGGVIAHHESIKRDLQGSSNDLRIQAIHLAKNCMIGADVRISTVGDLKHLYAYCIINKTKVIYKASSDPTDKFTLSKLILREVFKEIKDMRLIRASGLMSEQEEELFRTNTFNLLCTDPGYYESQKGIKQTDLVTDRIINLFVTYPELSESIRDVIRLTDRDLSNRICRLMTRDDYSPETVASMLTEID